MRFLNYSIIAVLLLSFWTCKSDNTPDTPKTAKHIFVNHYVRYLQSEHELKAEVTFKEGDTLASARSIVLADVNFEDTPMTAQNLGKNYGIRYSFRKKGPFKEQYQFNYTGNNIERQVHTVKMSPITEFLIKEGKVNKNSGATVVWNGEALGSNQAMVLLFTDVENKAIPVQVKGPTERSEIFLPAEKLKNLSSGKGQLMIVKKQFSNLREKSFTKTSEMEFYTDNLDIEVMDK